MAWNRDGNISAAGTKKGVPPHGSLVRTVGGVTILELMVVLAITASLLAMVTPHLINSSHALALINARSRISSAVSLTRATATQHGRVAYLVLDGAMDRVSVEVDTSFSGGQTPVQVHTLDLWNTMDVDLRANDPLLCFDSRGISVTTGPCPGTGTVIYVRRGVHVDSVVVSSTGRILQ
jgi:type II secretory pathway pseudopilin PulG